jgi:hypothetical protein
MTKTKIKFDLATGEERVFAAPWAQSHATMLAAQAIIDGVDAIVHRLETNYGFGRLRLAVSDDLREKFDRQRLKWHHALKYGDLGLIQYEAERTKRAWLAVEKSSGLEPLTPDVWEVVLNDGSVAAIVKDNDAAKYVAHNSDRALAIYTLAEIGRLIDGFPAIVKAKEIFTGATVTSVRDVRDPLEGLELDEQIPF